MRQKVAAKRSKVAFVTPKLIPFVAPFFSSFDRFRQFPPLARNLVIWDFLIKTYLHESLDDENWWTLPLRATFPSRIITTSIPLSQELLWGKICTSAKKNLEKHDHIAGVWRTWLGGQEVREEEGSLHLKGWEFIKDIKNNIKKKDIKNK